MCAFIIETIADANFYAQTDFQCSMAFPSNSSSSCMVSPSFTKMIATRSCGLKRPADQHHSLKAMANQSWSWTFWRPSGQLCDGNKCIHCPLPPLFFTYLSSGRRGLSSRSARIKMGTLVPMISSCKLILQSTFSKASPKAMPRLFSSLTMHLAFKNELWMQYRPEKCQKMCPFRLFFTLFSNSHRHRAEEGLDAPPRWATYVTQSAPKWQCPVILFSEQPFLNT